MQEGFSAKAAAKTVLRSAATGALATLGEDGTPFASLVTVATEPDGTPLMLLSTLAVHTRNLARDARASLLLVAPGGEGGDPLAGARLTLTGTVERTDASLARSRFLARHQAAADYADFADFGFYRLEIAAGHLVAGFGRIVDLTASDLLTDLSGARPLIEAHEEILAHMNADHREAMRLYATRLAGAPDGEWRVTGCDPEGLDLMSGERTARIAFPAPVRAPGPLRQVLRALAEAAREAPPSSAP